MTTDANGFTYYNPDDLDSSLIDPNDQSIDYADADALALLDAFDVETIKSQGIMGKLMPGPYWLRSIIVTEACERYAYYSLRAILTLYLKDALMFQPSHATSVSLYSQALSYFMCAVGGYISDTYWGKYTTILRFCFVYILGSTILSLTAIDPYELGMYVGLFCIAIGTGGIKPCVSSFGADQFGGIYSAKIAPEQVETEQSRFFSIFYFSINLGSLISYILSPIIRSEFSYAAAFGVPAVFLTLALWIFWRANAVYLKNEATGSIVGPMYRAIKLGFNHRKELKNPENQNQSLTWLDMARGRSEDVTDADVLNAKCFLKVLTIFSVMPLFWALFDQHSNAWVLQAEEMNRHGLQPEQMNVLNPIFVLVFLPLFDRVVYPWFKNRGINFDEFRRIGVGMLLSVLSFLCSTAIASELSQGRNMSVFAQIPQFLFISIAEVLISVTCLEYAYKQAPDALKSTLTACWMVSTGLGNLIAGLIWEIVGPLLNNTEMNLLFSMLMLTNFMVFLFIAYAFDPRPVMVIEAEREEANARQSLSVREELAGFR